MNKPLILYYSKTGNTAKLVNAMAEVLDAEVVSLENNISGDKLAGRPLIGLGSGIYWGRHHSRVLRAASRLPRGSPFFLFSTSGIRFGWVVRMYNISVNARLNKNRRTPLGRFHCPGEDQKPIAGRFVLGKGRPDARDLEEARAFAGRMKAMAGALG